MTEHRINVLGASGSGASTAGAAVAKALDLPYFDSDDFFHEPTDPPFSRQRSPQARNDLLTKAIRSAPSWVIGGGVAGWAPASALRFSLVVLLWLPADLRLERLRTREQERFGARVRSGGDMHAQHEAFIEWASGYDRGDVQGKTLARHEAYLAEQTCPVLKLEGPLSVEETVRAILRAGAHS